MFWVPQARWDKITCDSWKIILGFRRWIWQHPPVAQVQVTTLQALTGGGQATILSPEMQDNVIPFIGSEKEKTEKKPLKILRI